MANTAPRDQVPNAAWRAGIVNGLVRLGYKGTALADIIAPGRTRARMCDDLIALQRTAKKAK